MTSGHRPTAATLRPVARAEADRQRRCTACGARLSAYNPGTACYAHTVDVPWKGPHHR